jgi:hypothetical protein
MYKAGNYYFLLLVVVALWTWSSRCYGQVVNIENRRIYDDTAGWSGSFDSGFSMVDNKDLLLNASLRPRVQFKNKLHYVLFLTDWSYSKGVDRVYANAGMVHMRYALRMSGKNAERKSPWKWESYTQVQYNELLDQRLRALIGTGLRVKARDKNGIRVFAGTSAFFEHEEIQTTGTFIEDVRWSNYLSWFIQPKSTFSFTGTTYYQPVFDDFSDYRFMGQYAMNFSVFKRIDFRFEYNTFFDSKPNIGVSNWLHNASFGVRVKLGE